MKFDKIVTIGISEQALDKNYWKKIDSFANKRVSLSKDSTEIKSQIADADCLLVNPFIFKVERDLIDAAPKLKYIGAIATAYAKIDFEHAAERGVAVSNIPGYSTESVAEFLFAVLLDHVQHLDEGKKRSREAHYSEEGMSSTEIKGKRFGIIGTGRIGSRVAQIAKAFGCDVRYWSRNRKPDLEAVGIKYENADEVISGSDILSLHLSQTKETVGFLNAERISKIKKGAIVLNTAPMELIDVDAMAKRLSKGEITFILDHSDEMTSEDLGKISKFSNCIIYPPMAYVSEEAKISKQEIFVSNIENFLKGKLQNKVN